MKQTNTMNPIARIHAQSLSHGNIAHFDNQRNKLSFNHKKYATLLIEECLRLLPDVTDATRDRVRKHFAIE